MTDRRPADTAAIIVAAGRSRRMEGEDKLWLPLSGTDGRSRPLLAYTLAAFQTCAAVGRLLLVVAEDSVERASALIQKEGFDNVCAVVPGGDRRQDSVRAGLEALGHSTWVIIHDGARPLVTAALIERGLAEAEETGAACCALPVADTVKESDAAGNIASTVDRSRLWLAQTPQTFRYELLLEAHRNAKGEATDDAGLVEALGIKVRLHEGTRGNIKVTTPEDLALAQALLKATR